MQKNILSILIVFCPIQTTATQVLKPKVRPDVIEVQKAGDVFAGMNDRTDASTSQPLLSWTATWLLPFLFHKS
jgi:hypothetical protein